MRKAFIEPDMKVIKLNLNENIAASGDDIKKEDLIGTNIPFNVRADDDTIVDTKITMSAVNELVNGSSTATYGLTWAQDQLLSDIEEYYGKSFRNCLAI